jgi:hypothetical protein
MTSQGTAGGDLLNPFPWWTNLRGARSLAIEEEQLYASRAAKLGARYQDGKAPDDPLETGSRTVRHVFEIYCAGPLYADAVTVWLSYGRNPQKMRTKEQHVGLLRPNDPPQKVEVVESGLLGRFLHPKKGTLMCRWTDGNGAHVEPLLDVWVHPVELWLPGSSS